MQKKSPLTFTQLLNQAKAKINKGNSGSRNYLNQSYQQFQFRNLQNFSDRLITGLDFINTKNQISSPCFIKILKNAGKFATSLLSLSFDIAQLLQQVKNIRLKHQNHSSQICMLAFYLRFYYGDKKIRIISTSTNKRVWEKYFIQQTISDSQGQLKSLFQQNKIQVSLFDQVYTQKQGEQQKNQIHLVDIFNVSTTIYRPYLLRNKDRFSGFSNSILYYSHVQENQVDEILSHFSDEFVPVQGSPSYPIQKSFQEKQDTVKKSLIDFLRQDANHPQKQDIIIFYRSDHVKSTSAKKYSMKLKELLSQQALESNVQLITQPRQTLASGKNAIFIAQNTRELIEWNYSYNNVFYVFDYGWQKTFRFDHQNFCFNDGLFKCNLVQRGKRMSFVGMSKVGKYLHKQTTVRQTVSYLDQEKQIMSYCLRMIDLNISEYLQTHNKRLQKCIQKLIFLKFIKKTEQCKFQIIDKEGLELVYKGIEPSSVRLIQQCLIKEQKEQKRILTNLIIIAICIINQKGNLRQSRQNVDSKTIIKPSGVWCRTGYLHSCLQILTKAQIIQNKQQTGKSLSRRQTSKANQNQYEIYGNLFQTITPKRVQFQDMQKIQDLIRQYYVNQKVFSQIREQIDQYRELFRVQRTNIKIDKDLISKVLDVIACHQKNSIAIFSGSRRIGYAAKHSKINIFPNRNSLTAQLNETPQFIYIVRCVEQQNKKEISMSNSFSHQLYFGVFGQLPPKRSDSLAEHQIQFHGISSATFKGLFRNNGNQMKKFQSQNNCFIEPNEQMATITIYCSKQKATQIKQLFQQFIGKVKEKLVCYNKVINYMGNTNLVVSNGGSIKQVVKDNYINKCILSNLDLEVQKQDLEELFDQFFVLKDIQIHQTGQNKHTKYAIIHFNSQKDYYRFHSYYHECNYMNRLMQVKPVISEQKKGVQAEKYIQFKWYVWKSHNKGMVEYFSEQHAEKAWVTFFNNPEFDGKKVEVQHKGNKVFIYDLPSQTDQIFLERGFSGYGKIKNVQILKTPLKQSPNQQSLLQVHIKSSLNILNNENHYTIKNIQKKKGGLRTCIVHVRNVADLNTLIAKLNGFKKVMGEGRLYADSWFTQPVLVTYPSFKTLYLQILQQTLKEEIQRPNISSNLMDVGNNRLYIILKSPLQPTLQYITIKFQQKLTPWPIELTELQSIVILSDIGIANIIDLQQKFNCKLIVNSLKKILTVLCRFQVLKNIKEQVKFRVKQKFFYRISLNTRAFKHFKNNLEKLEEIKKNCFLSQLQLQEYSKTLIFEGSAHHVQNSLNIMMHLIESLTVPQEQLINTDTCLICCQQITRPYRLQNCGHKFCFGCLDQAINSALGDMSLFPIKCPHCRVQLVIDDLQSLVDPGSWIKLINMAANQFVGQHSDVMTFCYTPGCKQINMLKLTNFRCDICGVSFCCECKQNWHQGLTCQQAKLGSDSLFKKYMLQNGVRQCPNKSCKMPIVRTDGCFRVTCSRCNKSMCFKCQPNKMIAYDDYNECYKHLNDAHGGYW